MSPIRIGLAVTGSLIAFTASASGEVRYNGFPKLGYSVVLPAPASAASTAGKSNGYDSRAELPKAEIPAPQSPFRKGGINGRGI